MLLRRLITLTFILALPFGLIAEDKAINSTAESWSEYYDSGTYLKEVDNVTKDAQAFLQQKINEAKLNPKEKLAIIFDIDETVLSNFENMKRLRFTKNKEALVVAYAQGKDPVIQPSLELYNFAKANNVTIFFVTGRADSEEIRKSSEENLTNVGFSAWKALIMRPLDYENSSIVAFKSGVRKQLTDEGYTIVLNIGDQHSDLAGGYALKSVKLPNPFYTLS